MPVCTGHSLAVNAEFERDITPGEALSVLGSAPGVRVTDVPNPLDVVGKDEVTSAG